VAEGTGADAGRGMADSALLRACVHCGLCLDACPTYVELGREADSPRGRIHLIRAVESGVLPLGEEVVRHLDLCLGCRACETACPSGVRYGAIIEEARAYIERSHRRAWRERLRRLAMLSVFPYPERMRLLLGPVRALQAAGLWPLAQRLIPFAALVPPLRPLRPLAERHPAAGAERGRVGLLAGCVARDIFAATNEATIRVLNHNGVTVLVPPAQACCGALHVHGGDPDTARAMARRNLGAFPEDLDAVVVNAAGCGAAMKEYGALLAGNARWAERARGFAGKVRDVTEFLAGLPAHPPATPLRERVAYHDACHLAHGQQVREAPRALLRLIPEIDLVELPESDLCCGSAGSYNLTEPEMARRLCERKVDNVVASGASCVASANPGCTMQILSGLRARGSTVRVAHPVELLAEAYATGAAASGGLEGREPVQPGREGRGGS
jgi:glycolate oxidase iron-sulfur subunit